MTASESFKQISGLDWLRKKDSLPSSAPSTKFSGNRDWIEACNVSEEGARLSAWFPAVRDRDVEEDVVGLGSYGRLLTVLVTQEIDEAEEEERDVEDGYIDRWKHGYFRSKR